MSFIYLNLKNDSQNYRNYFFRGKRFHNTNKKHYGSNYWLKTNFLVLSCWGKSASLETSHGSQIPLPLGGNIHDLLFVSSSRASVADHLEHSNSSPYAQIGQVLAVTFLKSENLDDITLTRCKFSLLSLADTR